MTQEEKDLLLKDLCGRLPYSPILNILGVTGYDEKFISINRVFAHSKYTIITNSFENPYNPHEFDIEEVRPYLRPLSSMTEEEEIEWFESVVPTMDCDKQLDFYCKYHFDYRGLIEKGLAIEAPEGMYNFE